MTKISFWAAAAGLTLLFTACKKKDKDSDHYKAAIVGKWTYVESFITTNGQNVPVTDFDPGEYARFTASDTVYTGTNATPVGGEDYSFYKVNGSNLTIANDKSFATEVETYHIDALNNSDLTFSSEDEKTTGIKGKVTVKLKK